MFLIIIKTSLSTSINITSNLQKGINKIAIIVWYFGVDSQKYKTAKAGVIFEIVQDNDLILCSNENVLSRKSLTYISGRKKLIGWQFGFSFSYDATKEDDWMK